jgi:hypothetical protein
MATLFALGPLALVAAGEPVARCPKAFHLHTIDEDGHGHAEHRHVGLSMEAVDRNGNGWICVKHVTPAGGIHVHSDDIPV